MMDAREEAADLQKNPLPEITIMDPLTQVWTIDTEIAALDEQRAALMELRGKALVYAIAKNISEDSRCRLEKKIRKTRTLDVTRFREVFPDQFRMACDIERNDLNERLTHIGEHINLTLVDRLVKKPMLEAAQGVVSVKESASFSVVLK